MLWPGVPRTICYGARMQPASHTRTPGRRPPPPAHLTRSVRSPLAVVASAVVNRSTRYVPDSGDHSVDPVVASSSACAGPVHGTALSIGSAVAGLCACAALVEPARTERVADVCVYGDATVDARQNELLAKTVPKMLRLVHATRTRKFITLCRRD